MTRESSFCFRGSLLSLFMVGAITLVKEFVSEIFWLKATSFHFTFCSFQACPRGGGIYRANETLFSCLSRSISINLIFHVSRSLLPSLPAGLELIFIVLTLARDRELHEIFFFGFTLMVKNCRTLSPLGIRSRLASSFPCNPSTEHWQICVDLCTWLVVEFGEKKLLLLLRYFECGRKVS